MTRVIVDPGNFSQFVKLPKGVYRAKISGHKVKTGRESGNEYIQWEHTILSQGPTEMQTIGKKIIDRAVLTEDSLWRLDAYMTACAGSHLPKGEFDTSELIGMAVGACLGKELMITVDDDPNRNDRSVVTTLAPVA